MRAKTASRVAWTSCTVTLVFGACAVALRFLNGEVAAADVVAAGGAVTSAVVGALVASRRPENPVGWFFLGGSMSLTLAEVTGEYAQYGLVTAPGSLPLASAMAWPQAWLWVPGVALPLIFLPLYFPNGRLLSPRWRWAIRLSAAFCVYSAVVAAFFVDEAEDGVANPLLITDDGPVVRVLEGLMQVLLVPVVFLAALSLVVRFRRSRGEERQQMKWLTYVAALMPALILLATVFPAADLVAGAAFASVPVVVGVAVLKYRLYDVDTLINRTLVYGALTASLALVYLGCVVLLQGLFRALTGEVSQLVIVASTLAIAALFSPMRRRIQALIDRSFYRGKYDARMTLEAYAARLREETDVDRLGEELVVVVRETVQPEYASLWLRGSTGTGEEKMLDGGFRNAFRNGGETVGT